MPEEPAITKPVPKKRLALFLDGTWKNVNDNTNVSRLKSLCSSRSVDGTDQLPYYHPGVTGLLGLLYGRHLSRNIRFAYEWLVNHYNPGDEIFIFGFSLGAYTARSLTGYIAKCGLLKQGAPLRAKQLYKRYRRPDARTIWNLIESRNAGTLGQTTLEERWMLKFSQPIHIKFVGVWETVGTLGIPWFHIRFISRSTLDFHDTGLRRPMENGFHALAIDEHRRQFPPTLWTVRRPKDSNVCIAAPRPLTSVEQRWFVGSHDNIGGGLKKNDWLANISLRWIMEKASLHGLAFQTDVHVDVDVVKAHIDDSYSDFVCGIYARFSSPYFRPIGEPPKEQSDGTHAIVNETIDVSVFDRWRSDREYRPNNLVDWARGHGIDIATLNNSVRASPQSSNIFPPPELFPTPGLFPPPALLPPPGQGFAPPTTFIKGSWWITYLFDQTLWVDPMDQTRSWGVFGNVGISDGRPNPIHWSAIFGIGGSSPIPNRKLDTFGIAYYYLGFSDSFKNLAPPFLRDERGLELFYNVAVTPWFHVTADLQVITPLLQPVHTSLVLGLRSKIIF